MRTGPDARAVREWIEKGSLFLAGMSKYSGCQTARPRTRAVVVGGGFIGLEMAENLVHRGFDVTVVELQDQILAPMDREMAEIVQSHLVHHGIKVVLGDAVTRFDKAENGGVDVTTRSGAVLPADLVILALGVRPDTTLAKLAGLEIGELGVGVDDRMQRAIPTSWLLAMLWKCATPSLGAWSRRPCRTRQSPGSDCGRCHRRARQPLSRHAGYVDHRPLWRRGCVDRREREEFRKVGMTEYEKIYLYPNSNAGYYPGATPIAMKVLFARADGKLFGAQAVGMNGVDKRISALAVAIQLGATIYDLEEAELCYAPQFGSAKDAVNFAGMVAADVLRGDMPVAHWGEASGAILLDVREPAELQVEAVEGAVNIPLRQLRERLAELPKDREIHVICRSGQRAYYATRVLLQNGYQAQNLSGGMLSRYHRGVFAD